jgi:hypothetical protein
MAPAAPLGDALWVRVLALARAQHTLADTPDATPLRRCCVRRRPSAAICSRAPPPRRSLATMSACRR